MVVHVAEAIVKLTILVQEIELEWTESERLQNIEKRIGDLTCIDASERTDEEAVAVVMLPQNRFPRAQIGEPSIQRPQTVDK